ncbi:MAG: hypothetical protein C0483_00525 [Pirellula sp.]|nr:hypothetical protein [Pirellula sp.]
MTRTPSHRLFVVGCLFAVVGLADLAIGQEAAKESAEKAAAPDAPPKIELTLPTTPKPTDKPVHVEEAMPTDPLGELLFSVGVPPSTWTKFTDGSPLSDSERRPLVGVFAAVRQLKPEDWSTYARPMPVPPATLDTAALWRAVGTLKSIAPQEFTDAELDIVYAAAVANSPGDPPRLADGDPRRKFFRCEVAVPGRTGPLIVYTLRVPDALRGKTTVEERIGVQGMYLKGVGAGPDGSPIFAADRLEWFKRTPLGDLGMDYGLYDDVRPFSSDLSAERECLFQLLVAMKKVDFAKLQELTKGAYSVVPLFNDGPKMLGELTAQEGQARRAVLVVADKELQRRYGISQYYEVALFTAESVDNPLLFNLLELPPGFPQGQDINETVRIPGTYLTGWTYKRDRTDAEKREAAKREAAGLPPEKPGMQKAPLLVGKSLVWLKRIVAAQDDGFSWLVNGAVIVLVLVIAAIAWTTLRADRTARDIVQRTNAPPAGTSLNDLPGDFRNGPDFSSLEARDDRK